MDFSFAEASVCSGCCDKVLQTGWRGNNTNVFLTLPEAGRPRPGYPHGQVRALCHVADFPLCPHRVEGARELSGVSMIRMLISFMRALCS